MNKFNCVYKVNDICGNNENCIGCCYDPQNRKMTYDEFRDIQYHWNCDSCKHCKPNADIEGIESTCKRLDHKHYSFAKATFYSYDCGKRNGCICADFEPMKCCVWLYNHWKKEYIKEYVSRISNTAITYLCIDHNWKVKYEVKKIDFVNGTFLNPDGSLKWIRKQYYKQSRKSPIGYVYCNEYPDGTIEYGANKPVNWSKVEQ